MDAGSFGDSLTFLAFYVLERGERIEKTKNTGLGVLGVVTENFGQVTQEFGFVPRDYDIISFGDPGLEATRYAFGIVSEKEEI
jgi:hypothetical protein